MSLISPFLKTPSEIWKMAKIDNKLKLQWFQFPSGVSFDGNKFGTTQIASIYKVKSTFLDVDSTVVDYGNEVWNQVVKEVEYLMWMLDKN